MQGEEAAMGTIFFTKDTDGNLAGSLHEEQGGADLPSLLRAGLQGNLVSSQRKTALVHQGSQAGLAAREQVPIKGGVDGEEATAEEQAAVVAAAGEHGRGTGGEILPAGVMGNFPEDGVEQGKRRSGRATAEQPHARLLSK